MRDVATEVDLASYDSFYFDPEIIRADVGDTVFFENVESSDQIGSIAGMTPDGINEWRGVRGRPVWLVLRKPGVYGFGNLTHYSDGMVGLILVRGAGMTDNLEAARSVSHPKLPGRVYSRLFAEIEQEMSANSSRP